MGTFSEGVILSGAALQAGEESPYRIIQT